MATYIYRLYNTTSGDHFYTASAAERDWIIQNLAHFKYEGIAWTQDTTPDRPVYRFYEFGTDSHFFTASVDERNFLQGIPAGFSYEGTAFQASSFADAGAPQPVYRFYNPNDGLHFFTASDEERDFVLNVVKSYRLENVAFYVAPPPPKNPVGTAGNDTLELLYSAPRYGETARGMAGNDLLIGGSGPDLMYGGDGNDNFAGYAGDDTAYGEAGDDLVQGGVGNDLLYGGAGNDSLVGEDGSDRLYGDAGNDLLYSGGGGNWLSGGSGDDTMYGGAGDTLEGGEGNDHYIYGSGVTIVDSGGAADSVTIGSIGTLLSMLPDIEILYLDLAASGSQQDTLRVDGGRQSDRIEVLSNFPATGRFTFAQSQVRRLELRGGDGNDTLVGEGRESALIYGDEGNDRLSSRVIHPGLGGSTFGTSSDALYGGPGEDTLDGVGGQDTLVGGSGNDVFLFDATSTARFTSEFSNTTYNVLIEDFSPGTDTIRFLGTGLSVGAIAGQFAAYQNIDGITGVRAVIADATSNSSFTIIIKGVSVAQVSTSWFAVGQQLMGTANDDVMYGTGGDTLEGGTGDDRYYISGVVRIIDSDRGVNQTFSGGTGLGIVYTSGNLTVQDLLSAGSPPSFIINGSAENQRLGGTNGTGIPPQFPASLEVHGGAGNDTISSGARTDVLYGDDGDDYLFANIFYDTTPALNPYVLGETITLYGGAGNDTLRFQVGQDTLVGGPGADLFELEKDARYPVGGIAWITDFEAGSDHIRIRGVQNDLGFDEKPLATANQFRDFTSADGTKGVRSWFGMDVIILGYTNDQVSADWFITS